MPHPRDCSDGRAGVGPLTAQWPIHWGHCRKRRFRCCPLLLSTRPDGYMPAATHAALPAAYGAIPCAAAQALAAIRELWLTVRRFGELLARSSRRTPFASSARSCGSRAAPTHGSRSSCSDFRQASARRRNHVVRPDESRPPAPQVAPAAAAGNLGIPSRRAASPDGDGHGISAPRYEAG